MTLLALLIGLGLQHILHLSPQRAQTWLGCYGSYGRALLTKIQLNDSITGICLLLAPLLIITLGIDYALNRGWVNILNFVFHIAVVFFCRA